MVKNFIPWNSQNKEKAQIHVANWADAIIEDVGLNL